MPESIGWPDGKKRRVRRGATSDRPRWLGFLPFGVFFDELIFIFGFVEDTLSRYNRVGVCFCARFFLSLACTEDTAPRQDPD
jgi:hypothetical protein